MKTCLRAAFAALIATIACFAGAAGTALADQTITSAGPLTNIYLGEFLDCQADHEADADHQFFGLIPGACGTFLAPDGTAGPEEVYGPDVPAGVPRIPYTPVSQSAVTGAGTAASPYQVVTVVDLEGTGLQIRQTDSYVAGDEFYRTDIEVLNGNAEPVDAVLYHAADCYLQESDDGYGFVDPVGGGIYCSENPDNDPVGRIQGFVPLNAGSQYIESDYELVWLAIDGSPLPNTCDCDLLQDNGAGISWEITVPAGGSVTRSLLTSFSPEGDPPPPPVSLTLSPPSAENRLGTSHTVTATLTQSGAPLAGGAVLFDVSGPNAQTGSGTTGASGTATFTYTGTVRGQDTIEACYDADTSGTCEEGEPTASATKDWVGAGPPANVVLSPASATNLIETRHCVTATVTDASGTPNPDVVVRFDVTGATSASGTAPTVASGAAEFCYTGPALPGNDTITAFADSDGSGDRNGSEPSGSATKAWKLPDSDCGVKITGGGWIQTSSGGWGHLNVNVKTKKKQGLEGKIRFSTRGINVNSWDVLVQTCDNGTVTLFGIATINGSRQHWFRIDIGDGGNPGRGNDTVRVRTDTGYDSGSAPVQRGNIKVHKK